jgi:hypothetical protein
MAMLMTAFDASGKEDLSCVSVAGFIANQADWENFDAKWRGRLATDHLAYFQMRQYTQNIGPFADRDFWTMQRRTALMMDLISIIQEHAYQKFGTVVINETFEQMSNDVRKRFRLTAYVLAARTTAGHVRQWALHGWQGVPIAYIFEEGDEGRGRLMERMERDAFPRPIFWPKKDTMKSGVPSPGFTALQAADILAYEHFLVLKRGEATRRSFFELDKYPPGVVTVYTARDLEELERKLCEIGDNPSVGAL